MIRVVILCI